MGGAPRARARAYGRARPAEEVDVLVVAGSRLVAAAQEATPTIPIVMVAGGDPVTTGLIASFARPGGTITGLTVHHPELSGKTLELLKETFPTSPVSRPSGRRVGTLPPCARWSVRPRPWAWRCRS